MTITRFDIRCDKRSRVNFFIAPLIRCEIEKRRGILEFRAALPIGAGHHACPTFNRTQLFLSDVVSPTAAVTTFATAHHQQIQNRTINNIGMIPVIDSAAHDDHCAPLSFQSVVGEFASRVNDHFGIDAREFFLPARSVRRVVVVRICTFAAKSRIDSVIRQRQIVNGRNEFHAARSFDFLDGNSTTNHRVIAAIISEIRQHQFNDIITFAQD